MKYTSKIKSRQFIPAEDGKKKIFIEPGKGEMTDAEALAVAKSSWGKRLIDTGSLTFEKKIEVKEENVQHGMTIKPGDKKGKKPSPPKDGANNKTDDSNTGGDGNENTDSAGNESAGDGASSAGDEDGDNEIPDFDKNAEGGGEV